MLVKIPLVVLCILIIFSGNLYSQKINFEFIKQSVDDSHPYTEISLGFAPRTGFDAIKFSGAVNNLYYGRLGAYTSFEIGINSRYFTNIIGGCVRIYKSAYVFAGMDWLTRQHGVFPNLSLSGIRKELGVGFMLFKFAAVRLGYSRSIGPSFTTGIRIPLNEEKVKYYFH